MTFVDDAKTKTAPVKLAKPDFGRPTSIIIDNGPKTPQPLQRLAPSSSIGETPISMAAGQILAAAGVRQNAAANEVMGPDALAISDRRRAQDMELRANALLDPDLAAVGHGGELIPFRAPHTPALSCKNTVDAPTLVTAAASRERLKLADDAQSLETALDLAETYQAKSSAEKMLSHQMAVLHTLTMKSGHHAGEALDRIQGVTDPKLREALTVQANRLVNATARATAEFQNCMLTFQKLRSGGKQTIVVQHVQNTQVNDGGKAIIAGGGIARTTPIEDGAGDNEGEG
ncbi:MAG TPA: hypothetical protein VGV14_10505 [Rhodanobacter sp.]|nr:hypothetical protein [Rhodanobacter sp.]